MTIAIGALLFFAAALAGAINSVAGGGSFVTFPTLLLTGVPPVAANATSTIALWPGSLASTLAYRRELADVRRELALLSGASIAGGLAGSVLLLHTSDRTFVFLVPWLLLFATLLFSFGGRASRKPIGTTSHGLRWAAVAAQLFISIYGGYFGGGIGIMMLAVLSVLGMTDLHRMNALKTLLAALVNGVAVVAFLVARAVAWTPGIVMIGGGIAGGYFGAAVAQKVDPKRVRWLVLAIAWGMTGYFFVRTWGYGHSVRPA